MCKPLIPFPLIRRLMFVKLILMGFFWSSLQRCIGHDVKSACCVIQEELCEHIVEAMNGTRIDQLSLFVHEFFLNAGLSFVTVYPEEPWVCTHCRSKEQGTCQEDDMGATATQRQKNNSAINWNSIPSWGWTRSHYRSLVSLNIFLLRFCGVLFL